MRVVFGDAFYWIALINRRDQWHAAVNRFNKTLRNTLILTSDHVLHEVLAHFSEAGPTARAQTASSVRTILASPTVEVVISSRDSFLAALDLYEARPDKGYSLTDCHTMNLMRDRGIIEVLSHDSHFAQERFTVLFP
jgi:predicted nucleic acid-binding protein